MVPRLALLAGVILSTACLAHSNRFDFPGDCVDGCVGTSACSSRSPGCMCLNRGRFLLQVVGCMSQRCNSQLNGVGPNFLDIMQRDCAAMRMPLSDDKIQAARKTAAALIKLPSQTQAPPPPPATTTGPRQPPPIQTSERNPPPSEIPTLSDEPPPPPSDTPPAQRSTVTQLPPELGPTQVPVPGGATPANPPPSEPTDSSPFAVPNAGAAQRPVGWWLGAGVPVAAALGLF